MQYIAFSAFWAITRIVKYRLLMQSLGRLERQKAPISMVCKAIERSSYYELIIIRTTVWHHIFFRPLV
jgi:hypothetical protein